MSEHKIVQPMIDELKGVKEPMKKPPEPAAPEKPAEQDQDAGGGYNPDHTIPQE